MPLPSTPVGSTSLAALIDALRCLPGVGQKSAQRMAFHLLQRDQDGARRLAEAMRAAVERTKHCAMCNTFTEHEMCAPEHLRRPLILRSHKRMKILFRSKERKKSHVIEKNTRNVNNTQASGESLGANGLTASSTSMWST